MTKDDVDKIIESTMLALWKDGVINFTPEKKAIVIDVLRVNFEKIALRVTNEIQQSVDIPEKTIENLQKSFVKQ
jgi:hypothetical protein